MKCGKLGSRYEKGVGVPQDDKRACVLFKLAADQGHHLAQFNLGIKYAAGQGVNQSDTLSYKYYQLSNSQILQCVASRSFPFLAYPCSHNLQRIPSILPYSPALHFKQLGLADELMNP